MVNEWMTPQKNTIAGPGNNYFDERTALLDDL
jgi:hypothetical protein